MKATYSYDPYGNAAVSGTPEGNSTTYTGRDDDGTGLMYNRARYYSPTLQRFISEDPAGVAGGAGGANLYTYGAGAPSNNTDPSGNNPLLIGCAAGGAISGLIELGIQKLSGRKNYGALGSAIAGGCITGALGGLLGDLGKFGEGGCLLNSFTPDTPVLMADGTRKPIKDIRVGDSVQATDPETGETRTEPVTALIDGSGQKHLIEITVRSGKGHRAKTGTVTATDGHPFWERKRHKWITAGHLKPGMWLRTSTGTWAQITAVRAYTKNTHAYNLTVAGLHTYYVEAGDTSVLVHNTEGCPTVIALGLTRTDANEYALQDFAESKGAQYYGHWEDFEFVIRDALKPDSKTIIHFNLEGIRNPAQWAETANLKNPYASDLTAWGLAMIKAAPSKVQARVEWANGSNPFARPNQK